MDKRLITAKKLAYAGIGILILLLIVLAFTMLCFHKLSLGLEFTKTVGNICILMWLTLPLAVLGLAIAGSVLAVRARREGAEGAKPVTRLCFGVIIALALCEPLYMVLISSIM